MNPYLTVVLLAGIALLQTTLAPHLALAGAEPQLILLTVVSWGFLRGGREGAVWGFLGGLMSDLLSGGPFGIHMLVLPLVGYLAGSREINVFRKNALLSIFLVVVATLAFNGLMLVLLQGLGWPMEWPAALRRVIMPAIVLNLGTLPFVYLPLRRLHRMLSLPQIDW